MIQQYPLEVQTKPRELIDITWQVRQLVETADIDTGLCHIFLKHTSASLIICENADPTVQQDLNAFMLRLVPDGDKLFKHTAEGSDDMSAHVRTVLTQSFQTIPITYKALQLGRWQGLYVWEHRKQSYTRDLLVTIMS